MRHDANIGTFFRIRQATAADVPSVVELEKQESLRKYPHSARGISYADVASIGFGESRVAKYRQRFCANPAGLMWVAHSGEEIIGFSAASKELGSLWVRKLYVCTDHQGRGVGTQLLREAERWLGVNGDISLGVADYDQVARKFYLDHGYVEGGVRPATETTIHATGKVIPEILMIKRQV